MRVGLFFAYRTKTGCSLQAHVLPCSSMVLSTLPSPHHETHVKPLSRAVRRRIASAALWPERLWQMFGAHAHISARAAWSCCALLACTLILAARRNVADWPQTLTACAIVIASAAVAWRAQREVPAGVAAPIGTPEPGTVVADVTEQLVRPSSQTWRRGRQLYVNEGAVQAKRPREGLASGLRTDRQRAAELWMGIGDSKWVSVAAFSALGMDLMQVGAPLSLIRECHDAALDEVHHTELCWDLVSAWDPKSAPARDCTLPALQHTRGGRSTPASLAVHCYVQGAYLERLSAEISRELVERSIAPGVVQVLETMRDDEYRHSEHAWDVIAWCLEADPIGTQEALSAAVLPALVADFDLPSVNGSFEEFGLAGYALQRSLDKAVRKQVSERLRMVLARSARSSLAA